MPAKDPFGRHQKAVFLAPVALGGGGMARYTGKDAIRRHRKARYMALVRQVVLTTTLAPDSPTVISPGLRDEGDADRDSRVRSAEVASSTPTPWWHQEHSGRRTTPTKWCWPAMEQAPAPARGHATMPGVHVHVHVVHVHHVHVHRNPAVGRVSAALPRGPEMLLSGLE